MATQLPAPRALSAQELAALSDEDKAKYIATWSSYNAYLKKNQEQHLSAPRGALRGVRATGFRGRGRGQGHYGGYQQYPYPPVATSAWRGGGRRFANISRDFNKSPRPASTDPSLVPSLSYKGFSRMSRITDDQQEKKQSEEQTTRLVKKANTLCPSFSTTGMCSRFGCPHIHDPEKTAICKRYLSKNGCNDNLCALAHEPKPNRMPHCVHFINGRCTNDNCQYAHVRIPSSAPICEPFARLGYCEKGEGCSSRHTFSECPDHVNKGHCDVKGCKLPHTIHAGRLRQQARLSRSPGADSEQSSNHSNQNSDGMNSPRIVDDRLDGSVDGSPDATRFTQQADYVPI